MDGPSWISTRVDAMTSDVIAPCPWKIFGCQNGLRLFKEGKERDSCGKVWGAHPAIMAVGVVDAPSEAIFRTIMSLGPSRAEWDFCCSRGSVVEHLDGHTDIVHMKLYRHWLPWGMKQRDLLVRRYWRREDDGTYVILSHSVVHTRCPPQDGYVRASLKSGGFVISPLKQGKQAVVKHMLAIDWKFWKSYVQKASARSITILMLGRLAAMREFFRANSGKFLYEFSSGELTREINLTQSENEEIKKEFLLKGIDPPSSTPTSSLKGLNDASDEFFDVPEPYDDDDGEHGWVSASPDHYMEEEIDTPQSKKSSTANFVKILHGMAAQKKGYVDLQEMAWDSNASGCFGSTLAKDATLSMPCSLANADPTSFLIRGSSYLEDSKKIKAKGTLMDLVGADWIRSGKREDNLGGRLGGIVQKYAARGGSEFFFIVNIQFPGTTQHSLGLYYMMQKPLKETPLLESFVNGDDAYRNSRFKLIPYISKGSWIVKQSVGKKACLIGQALEVHYHRGENYLELDVDVGSSTVARGVVNLVLGYLNNLVIEMAFLIQGNTQELPECLLGTCRLNHLDTNKSVDADSIAS